MYCVLCGVNLVYRNIVPVTQVITKATFPFLTVSSLIPEKIMI